MTRIKYILIVALMGVVVANAAAQEVQLGNQYYADGEYDKAIEQYRAVLAEGQCSADLYYNLGNAYYRENDMAHAILNYRRALRLKPNMDDAQENLALAESHTADRITPLPRIFTARWIDALQTKVTPHAWRMLWIVLLALTCAAFLLMAIGRKTTLRKVGLGAGTVLAIMLLIATILTLTTTHRYNAHRDAIVMDGVMSVKGSPEERSTDKMLLHEGTEVRILDELSGWYKISIADGTTGWCEAQSVERI